MKRRFCLRIWTTACGTCAKSVIFSSSVGGCECLRRMERRVCVPTGEFQLYFLTPACRWRSQPLVSPFLCQQRQTAVTVHDHFTSVWHGESHPVCQTQSGFVCVVLQLFMSFLNCHFGDQVSSELAAVYFHVLLWSYFRACWCRKFIQIQNEDVWKPSKGENIWSFSQVNRHHPEILMV